MRMDIALATLHFSLRLFSMLYTFLPFWQYKIVYYNFKAQLIYGTYLQPVISLALSV